MKKTILLSVFGLLVSGSIAFAQTKVWTKQYESRLYALWDAEGRQRLSDDQLRHEFVTYMIKRFKQELPNGLESVPRDSLLRLAAKVAKEKWHTALAKDITKELKPTLRPWNKVLEQTLWDGLYTNLKQEDKPNGKFLCDCAVLEMKKMYPDSLMIPIPKEKLQQASDICYKKLDASKGKKQK